VIRSDRIGIRLFPDQPHAQPVIAGGSAVLEQEGAAPIERNEHVCSAIVVEITDGQAARCKTLGEDRAGSRADILERLARVVKQ